MQWQLQSPQIITTHQELLESLLSNRDVKDKQEFLQPKPPTKITPGQLKINSQQLKKAIVRMKQAISNQEKVVIYGDYDADGICATSVVWQSLDQLGLKAQPFIPDRLRHGYGLSLPALQEIIAEHKPDLIITVDNGIVANQELDWLKEQQIDVIVTDHHQPADKPLPATAIVHSTAVCGAGVAWMLMKELNSSYAEQLLDLAAIATVADQMPLHQANRSLVKFGIQQLRNNHRPGLAALNEIANIKPQTINTGAIGFMIAPRLNAAGRIAQGMTAARLLCTTSQTSARKLARQLDQLNQDRQDLTLDQYALALEQAQQQQNQKLIIVHSKTFHEGVIGLLSGKLTEQFYKPSIAIATENATAKASARSVKGVNITVLIREVKADLLSVGGHELAAGFSVSQDKLQTVINKLQAKAQDTIDQLLLKPTLKIDALIDQQLLDMETVELLDQLEPFGIGNPQPILALNKVVVRDILTMGSENQHLKLIFSLQSNDYQTYNAVGWGMGDWLAKLKNQQQLDLAFNLEINQWNSKSSLQLKLKDIVTDSA